MIPAIKISLTPTLSQRAREPLSSTHQYQTIFRRSWISDFVFKIYLASTISFIFILVSFSQGEAQPLRDSEQAIVVITKDWTAVPGVLQRFERSSVDKTWKPVGKSFPVVVGRNGLSWGSGLNPLPPDISGSQKKEGDGKAPAGIFTLGTAFGFAPASTYPKLKIPYLQLTSAIECVDDASSAYYNQITDASKTKKIDWNSSEKMAEQQLYKIGLVVEDNKTPIKNGKGSCIFMHIWRGEAAGTAGCTAMEENNLSELLFWLDTNKKPLLIQLPEEEYVKYQKEWELPEVDS